jgi:hypothetical protein
MTTIKDLKNGDLFKTKTGKRTYTVIDTAYSNELNKTIWLLSGLPLALYVWVRAKQPFIPVFAFVSKRRNAPNSSAGSLLTSGRNDFLCF